MFQKPGSGGVGVGPNSAFGNQFGAYADFVVQRVTQKWQTNGLAGLQVPVAVITFDIPRDGSVKNAQIAQRAVTLRSTTPPYGPSRTPGLFPRCRLTIAAAQADVELQIPTTAMKRTILLASILLGIAGVIGAQQINEKIKGEGEKPTIAVPDFRGSGDAQKFMGVFNSTLFNDLSGSGQLKMIPKTLYPINVPQQPSDFRQGGPAFADWSGPPPNANYLAFGYTAAQSNQIVLYGWLFDVRQANPGSAQVIGKIYLGSLDEAGARKVAQEFAADILKQFGATSLIGTKIYFVSDRSGHKEIWSMNYDGSEQKQFTNYRSITTFPAISTDGTKIAFTTYPMLASSRNAAASQFGKQTRI